MPDAFELTDLEVDEISLVDAPANPGAKVAFWKRGGPNPEEACATMENVEKVGLLKRLMKTLGVGTEDLTKEDDSVADNATHKLEALQAEVEKLKAERGADQIAESIAKALQSQDPGAELTKLEGQVAELKKSAGDKDARIADLEKRLEDAQKSAAEAAEVAKATDNFRSKLPKAMQPAFDEMDDEQKRRFMDKFSKSAGDEEPLAKALSAVEKSEAENEKLSKRLEKLEGEREVEKARGELAGLEAVVDVDQFVKRYVSLRKTDSDTAEALVSDLRAAAKRAETGALFATVGRAGGEAPTASEAINKVVAKRRETHPDESKEASLDAALRDNPELYTAYKAELTEGR